MPKKRSTPAPDTTAQAPDGHGADQPKPDDGEQSPRVTAAVDYVKRAVRDAKSSYDLTPEETRAVLKTLLSITPNILMPTEPLPEQAPEFWAKRDLNRRENAPQFIRRVYAHWLGKGLARKDLAHLDEDLYRALSVWLARHPDDDIIKILPSQSERIDDVIERLTAEYPMEFLRKLGYAIDSRIRRQKN